jgi:hypothetical protein
MHPQHIVLNSVDWLRAQGLDDVQAQRLAFVRWSVLEARKAQFCEFITSEAALIKMSGGDPAEQRQVAA